MPWDRKRRPPSEYINPNKAARVIAAHAGVCHICGHPGAEQVDHIIPWSEWTCTDLSVHDASNLAPAHGQPCVICGARCHADKSKAEAARGRARATQHRAAAARRPTEPHPGSVSVKRGGSPQRGGTYAPGDIPRGATPTPAKGQGDAV